MQDADPKLPDCLTFKRDHESYLFQCRVFQLLNVGVKILKSNRSEQNMSVNRMLLQSPTWPQQLLLATLSNKVREINVPECKTVALPQSFRMWTPRKGLHDHGCCILGVWNGAQVSGSLTTVYWNNSELLGIKIEPVADCHSLPSSGLCKSVRGASGSRMFKSPAGLASLKGPFWWTGSEGQKLDWPVSWALLSEFHF